MEPNEKEIKKARKTLLIVVIILVIFYGILYFLLNEKRITDLQHQVNRLTEEQNEEYNEKGKQRIIPTTEVNIWPDANND